MWEVIHGENQKVLKEREAGQANLLIADPPYNLAMAYEAYEDKKAAREYLEWAHDWMKQAVRALHDSGTMWVFINDTHASDFDVMLRHEFGLHRRSWVIWHYTFGRYQGKNFTPSHTPILYYVKDKDNYTFNANDPALRVPSARQVKYKDKRANNAGRLPDNTWVLFPEQLPEAYAPDSDTWLQSRVCGTFKERKSVSPNQLPLPILERIILATSNVKDNVVDIFCGTGAAGEVAVNLDRDYLGIDVSEKCCAATRERIQNVCAGQ